MNSNRLLNKARFLFPALSLLCLCGCAAWSYLGYRIAPDYPRDRTETFDLPGLSQPVKVYLDSGGIAHIDAASEEDLLRAVGFVHARSRFFQMDMMRRLACGRLSELVGERRILSSTTVEFDRSMRGWGFDKASREDVTQIDTETRRVMGAYVEGVNQGMARFRPIEYRLIRVEPEPWTMEDSLAVGLLNAWSVTHNWQQELSRLLLAMYAGIDRAEKIYPSEAWSGGVSLPGQAETHTLLPAIAPELRTLFPGRPYTDAESPEGQGHTDRGVAAILGPAQSASNAWVVGGGRSASGKPLLANDPHVAHILPSIMFQQHLMCPGLDVIGATIPGIPYVLAGHNREVAWGMTSTVTDVIDLYVEATNPSNPEEVKGPSGFEPIVKEEIVLKCRKGSSFEEKRFTLRRTGHGPLLNDIYPGLIPQWAPLVSLRWDIRGAAAGIVNFGRADRARNVEELRQALGAIPVPGTTWTAADVDGRIALFPSGRIPVRKDHLGTFPVPGWLPAYEWRGAVESARLPYGTAGREGLFAHANNLMVEPSRSNVFLNIDSAPSYRFDRIVELLKASDQHTFESFARIQGDVHLLRARQLMPYVLKDLGAMVDPTPTEAKALALLKAWDFEATAGSAPTAIFFVTYREAVIEGLKDEVGEKGLEFILSQRYSTNVADLWFESANHVVWDHRGTPEVEDRASVVQAAFKRAVAMLQAEQGKEPSAWRWGRLHDIYIKHVMGTEKLIAGFVNLPQAEAPGALDSVWKSHFDLGHPATPFRAMAGPAYRMIVDIADMDHGRWVLETGISGWPGSPHYGDQHELWKRLEYLPMVSDWGEIRAKAVAVLTLK